MLDGAAPAVLLRVPAFEPPGCGLPVAGTQHLAACAQDGHRGAGDDVEVAHLGFRQGFFYGVRKSDERGLGGVGLGVLAQICQTSDLARSATQPRIERLLGDTCERRRCLRVRAAFELLADLSLNFD